MRKSVVIIFLFSLMTPFFFDASAYGERIAFIGVGELFGDKEVIIDQKMVGLVGDVIELPQGVQSVTFRPFSYNCLLSLTLSIEETAIVVLEHTEGKGLTCSEETGLDTDDFYLPGGIEGLVVDVIWPRPTVVRPKFPATAWVVQLKDPSIENPRDRSGGAFAALGCRKQKIVVNVRSEPEGGEIWINGKKQRLVTNATLSVPLCTEELKALDVLVRVPGKVPCQQSVPFATETESEVFCRLKEGDPSISANSTLSTLSARLAQASEIDDKCAQSKDRSEKANTVWQYVEITWFPIVTPNIRAVHFMATEDGDVGRVPVAEQDAMSPIESGDIEQLRRGGNIVETPQRREDLQEICGKLRALGWEREGIGKYWYSYRFRKQVRETRQ